MLHKMKLNESPFERIKNGSKTIEFRLYDEKRQKVKIGDKIEFSKLPDLQEKLLVDVTGLLKKIVFMNYLKNYIMMKKKSKKKLILCMKFIQEKKKLNMVC